MYSHNYHVGNCRAHAQLAIKHSIPLQRSLKQFQVGVPVQRREQLPALLAWVAALGLWVSMSWIRWTHTAYGPAQRHHFEACSARSQCCSRRAETSPVGSVLEMGPCPSSFQAGSRSTSGKTDLPVSYSIMGGGWFLAKEVEICPCCQQPCWSNSVWTPL